MWFFRRIKNSYDYCVTIPDRLYPFSEEINGEKVRWRSAYDQALARVQHEYGYGSYGLLLITYRGIFHIIGAVLFVFFSVLVSRDLVGSDGSLYLLFAFVAAGILYQELYLQKHTHGQKLFHSFIDWFSWIVPMVMYMFAHTHNINLSDVLTMISNELS